MIYCPHCQKPSARTEGACPHCREDLGAPAGSSRAAAHPGASRAAAHPGASRAAAHPGASRAAAHPGASRAAAHPGASRAAANPVPEAQNSMLVSHMHGGGHSLAAAHPAIVDEHDGVLDGTVETGDGHTDILIDGDDSDETNASDDRFSGRSEQDFVFKMDAGEGGEITNSGLALESLAPPAPRSGSSPVGMVASDAGGAVSDRNLRDLSGFGEPSAGMIGAVKYWLHVRKRLGELQIEIGKAEQEALVAQVSRQTALVKLGRAGKRHGLSEDQFVSLASVAELLDLELKGAATRRVEAEEAFQARQSTFENSLDEARRALAPYLAREAKELAELKTVEGDRKRVEVRKKRVEIELRNLDNIIAKRQGVLALEGTTDQEKLQISGEVVMFEEKRTDLLKNLALEESEVETFNEPILQARKILEATRVDVAKKREVVSAIDRQLAEALDEFTLQTGAVSKEMEGTAVRLAEAWAAVGEYAMNDRSKTAELGEYQRAVFDATAVVSAASTRLSDLMKAKDLYDNETMKKAVQVMVGAGLCFVLIVGSLIYLANL